MRIPVKDAVARLRSFDWDSAPDLVVLTPTAALHALDRYASADVSAAELAAWADAIEGRDDISFPQPFKSVLKGLIFELANPEIARPLTPARIAEWAGRLRRVG